MLCNTRGFGVHYIYDEIELKKESTRGEGGGEGG